MKIINEQVLSFDEALKTKMKEDELYDESIWHYVPKYYCSYRYILGTKGKNPLICIGINPSTAKPDKLDNTLKSVERIAKSNGFDSFMMLNVYPQRATNPDDMDHNDIEILRKGNIDAIKSLVANNKNMSTIWIASGTIIDKRGYLRDALSDLYEAVKEFNPRWVSVGKISKSGHPHHPLYLKRDEKISDFDIDKYIKTVLLK